MSQENMYGFLLLSLACYIWRLSLLYPRQEKHLMSVVILLQMQTVHDLTYKSILVIPGASSMWKHIYFRPLQVCESLARVYVLTIVLICLYMYI